MTKKERAISFLTVKKELNKMDITSSMVSAGADVVMALVAIGGLVVALNWKREATQELAIQHCSNILSDHLPYCYRSLSITSYEKSLIQHLKGINHDVVSYITLKDLYSIYKSNTTRNDDINEVKGKLYADYNRVKSLSWDAKKDKKDTFDSIIAAMKDITADDFYLGIELSSFFYQFGDDDFFNEYGGLATGVFNHNQYNIIDYTSVTKIIECATELLEEKQKAKEKFKELDLDNMNVFDLFESKK